ncbi:MAG TPA: ABC transporter ATP-binding protein [Firmicutes bacterium]|nr:ABC transporter ATP-binding protein [Bacillota bacterium]
MAEVVVDQVTKRYGDVIAVDRISFTVNDGEFVVLVGPSGCGKSTTLRMIAGLELITEGKISIDDRIVNNLPPGERQVAMVFQDYALYPHMTGFENIAFGMRIRKTPRAEIEDRVRRVAEQLQIQDILDRKPGQMSGGQRQRVALARAMVRDPKVYLFDEPLSNLDAKLRISARNDLIRMHQEFGTTALYVTHDQTEAMTMGDRVAVFSKGRIHQIGAPEDLYDRPVDMHVAGFIGTPGMNFLKCHILRDSDDLWVDCEGLRVKLPAELANRALAWTGKKAIFGIRPEDVYVAPAFPHEFEYDESWLTSADLEMIEPLGTETLLHMVTPAPESQRFIAVTGYLRRPLREGQALQLILDMRRCHLFDPETQKAIF